MLKQRILSAVVMLIFMFVALFYFPPIFFIGVLGLICLLAMWEWSNLVTLTNTSAKILNMVVCFSLLSMFSYYCYYKSDFSFFFILILLGITIFWYLFSFILTYNYPSLKEIWSKSKILKLMMGYLSICSFFISIILIKYNNYIDVISAELINTQILLSIFSLVWTADIGAFFAGKLFGRHKLIPHVSPGKTIEGAIAGIIFTILVGFIISKTLLNDIIFPLNTIKGFAIYTIAFLFIALFSIQGDLLESMLKREANIKDSGNLIPGHGGVLDRIDSLLFVVPAVCFFILIYQVYSI